MSRVQVFFVCASFLILLYILEMIRRKSIKDEYSILWLLGGFTMILFSLWEKLLSKLSKLLGIFYPPSTIFIIGLLFLLLISIHFSHIISKIIDQNRRFAQEIGLLKEEVERLKSSSVKE